MDHITESQAAASEFLNLIQENRNVNLIFQDMRQKAETESRTVFEKSVKTQVSQRMAEEQKRAVGKMTVQRMINWLQQAESEQNAMPGQSLKNGMNHQTIFLQNQKTLQSGDTKSQPSAAVVIWEGGAMKRGSKAILNAAP